LFCLHRFTYAFVFLVTAAGRTQLKSMPMSKLRNYINAYNISTERVVEKDDLIDALLKARVSGIANLSRLANTDEFRAKMGVYLPLMK
jgi:hypothetical protein